MLPPHPWFAAFAALILIIPAALQLTCLLLPPSDFADRFRIHKHAFVGSLLALVLASFPFFSLAVQLRHRPTAYGDILASQHPMLALFACCFLITFWSVIALWRATDHADDAAPSTSDADATPPGSLRPRLLLWSGCSAVALIVGVLFHRHPHAHWPVHLWLLLVIATASLMSLFNGMGGALSRNRQPSRIAGARAVLHCLARVALPSLLTLLLAWHASLILAHGQDHRALAFGRRIVAHLKPKPQPHPSQNAPRFPDHLPDDPEFTAPNCLPRKVQYHPLDNGRHYRLIIPRTATPGLQFRYDSDHPGWYTWGSVEW